ncbi:MAG: hypothetical protein KDD64_07330 [Bdellovibrionales bacterium]|nr:hypothetical protein [Bdellovibrionales bacterium]
MPDNQYLSKNRFSTPKPLHFLVAFHGEGKALIEHLSLKKDLSNNEFPAFVGENAVVGVTGVGRVNAALVTALCIERYGSPETLVINLGICGSASLPHGTICSVVKVHDREARTTYFPEPLVRSNFFEATLETHSQPVTDVGDLIAPDNIVDMEASGVLTAAYRFFDTSQVQIVKIVSDALSDRFLQRSELEELFQSHTEAILRLTESLQEILTPDEPLLSDADEKLLKSISERLRLTHQQQFQLRQEATRSSIRLQRVLTAIELPAFERPRDKREAKKFFQEVLDVLAAP